MTVTKWRYVACIITKNKAFGKQLAKLAATFPNDPGAEDGAFEDGYQLSPQAWAMQTTCTQKFIDVLEALTTGASIDDPRLAYLKSRGLTASVWAQAKTNFSASWYRLWQDDGSYSEQPGFFEDFLTSQGYTYTVPETGEP